MNADTEDGSTIDFYEFKSDLTGTSRIQTFKDNRCAQKASETKNDFIFEMSDEVGPQVSVTLNFKKKQKESTTQIRFAFQKLGAGNRARIAALYLSKKLGKTGKEETVLDSKEGESWYAPSSLFSRSK
jgi:hypothetical protein